MKKTKGFLIALAIGGALFFNGCGDSTNLVAPLPNQVNPAEHIFVPNAGNSNVASKTISLGDGNVVDVQQIAAGTTPRMVKTHPTQRYIYVANQGSDNISVYLVTNIGGLSQVGGSPFAAPLGVTSITIDPSGRFLYAAGNNNQIRTYAIDANGALSNPTNQAFTSVPTIVAPVFTRTANGLFVNFAGANGGAGSIETFSVNETTGALTANSVANVGGSSVDGLSVHPGGTVLVASVEDNTANSSSLLPLTLGTNGALTAVNGNAVALNFDCGNTALSGQGIVYVGSDSSNNVSAFSVNGTTGALAPIAGSPFAAGQISNWVVLDPRNGLLYAVDAGNSLLSGLLLNTAGGLTVGAGAPNGTQLVAPNLPDFALFSL